MGKNVSSKKIIGVLGGMGPQASAEFYRILIEKSTQEFQLASNDDFPEIVIDSIPVPDFISNTKNMHEARTLLLDRVKRLNAFGVGQLCIPCNTAHLLIDDLRQVSSVPIVSILEQMRKVVENKGYKNVGLFASPTTLRMNLYDVFPKDIRVIPADEEIRSKLNTIIRGVISGKDRATLRKKLTDIAVPFIKTHAIDALILGCTELPLVAPIGLSVPVISSLDVLASSVLGNAIERSTV